MMRKEFHDHVSFLLLLRVMEFFYGSMNHSVEETQKDKIVVRHVLLELGGTS